MYQLIRADNELRLVARKGKRQAKPTAMRDHALKQSYQRFPPKNIPDFKTWRSFIKTGKVQPGLVASHIADSWSRCLQAEVEYAGGACEDILSPRELSKREGSLLEIAAPVMDALSLWLRSHPFVVVLVDHDGYIIRSIGEQSALKQAERLNFGPGANWSENSVGTNAIGTTLAIGSHVQVTGREHYNDGHHQWTCAASPILAPDGRPVGCLDISGPMENASPKLLEMAKAASLFIAERIGLEHGWQELLTQKDKMDAVMDMVSEPVITLNRRGNIQEANLAAARLLGRPLDELLGKPHQAFLSIGNALQSALQGPGPVQGITQIHTSSGRLSTLFNCREFHSREGLPDGYLITLDSNPETRLKTVSRQGDPLNYRFKDIVGRSRALAQVMEHAKAAAKTDSTVLLLGESGVGKEMFAQSIHQASARGQEPFVAVNCGAFAPDLVQSELFGYADGAFTGAQKGGRSGKLEQAHGGTLFLDEIAEMPLDMQVNLLRFLESRTYRRVGGAKTRSAEVRIIAATNCDLHKAVEQGNFRRDLFYRLYVVAIQIPALRQRKEDIPALAAHILPRLAARQGKIISGISRQASQALMAHLWPGNVRELQNALERAVNLCRTKRIGLDDLPTEVREAAGMNRAQKGASILPLAALEKKAIEEALESCRGNISRTAKALGIGRNTLYEKIRRHGIATFSKRKTAAQ
jgi:transcriptional regulator of acetoin/glycerol metabolism